MHMQPNTCTNEAFFSTYLQDLIPTLAGVVAYTFMPAKVGIKSCRYVLKNASFVHVFGCMCMLELTVAGWWIIVAYLSIPNWFELHS